MASAPTKHAEKARASEEQGERQEESTKKDGAGSHAGKEEDAGEDTWFYIDTTQQPQGPFTWEQMSAWYKSGYLKADLPVMKAGEEDFTPLQQHAAFGSALQSDMPKFEFSQQAPAAYASWVASMSQQQQQQFSTMSQQQQMQKYQDYMSTASFNMTSGRFQAAGGGIGTAGPGPGGRRVGGEPTGSAGRQLAHYFDIDAWQAQKQREKELGLKPKKVKNWRDLKDARKERKQRSYVKGLLKD